MGAQEGAEGEAIADSRRAGSREGSSGKGIEGHKGAEDLTSWGTIRTQSLAHSRKHGPRPALLLVTGDHVSAESPQPEPISTGSRYWSSDAPPAHVVGLTPQPQLDIDTPGRFRLTLIDGCQRSRDLTPVALTRG